jgi:hypothetical protein
MIALLTPFLLSLLGGIIYSFLFTQTKKIQQKSHKIIIQLLVSFARILFLGFFLHFLLKSYATHSILIIISFITAFILTTVIRHKP